MRLKLKPTVTAPLLALVMYLLMAASSLADIEKLGQRDNVFLAVIILQIVIFIIPGILYCKFKGNAFISKLRFNSFGLNISVFSFILIISHYDHVFIFYLLFFKIIFIC